MLAGMESFVVHIHRRPADTGPGEVVGLVEAIHNGENRVFTGVAELLAALGLDRRVPPQKSTRQEPHR